MRKTQIKIDLSTEEITILRMITELKGPAEAETMRQTMLQFRELEIEMEKSAVYRIANTAGEQLGKWWWRSSNSHPNAVLIRSLIPPELAEDIIANLEHHYATVWLQKHSARTAKFIFYAQNMRVVLSNYVGVIRGALEAYFKLSK